MTEARSLPETLRDAALAGLRIELDGLMAMFAALGLQPSMVGPGAEPEAEEDLDCDNLPV